MSRDIPNELKKQQEKARQATLVLIQKSIGILKEGGEEVTKKRLIETTGLAASTFSKEHVKALLAENQVCQFKARQVKESDIQDILKKHREADTDKKDREIARLNQKLIKAESDMEAFRTENAELSEKYQRLLGMYHILQRKISIYEACTHT